MTIVATLLKEMAENEARKQKRNVARNLAYEQTASDDYSNVTAESYASLYDDRDEYYQYSDDPSVWRRGEAAAKRLSEIAKLFPDYPKMTDGFLASWKQIPYTVEKILAVDNIHYFIARLLEMGITEDEEVHKFLELYKAHRKLDMMIISKLPSRSNRLPIAIKSSRIIRKDYISHVVVSDTDVGLVNEFIRNFLYFESKYRVELLSIFNLRVSRIVTQAKNGKSINPEYSVMGIELRDGYYAFVS